MSAHWVFVMASIRKRGDRWHVQVRRQGWPSRTKSFLIRADAEAWARVVEIESDQGFGQATSTRALGKRTIREIIERYRDEVIAKKPSAEQATYLLNAFLRTPVANLSLARATAYQFGKYRDARLASVGPDIVRRELSLIQTAFQTAILDWGIPISANPLSKVRKPPAGQPRERRLKEGELGRLISEARPFERNDLTTLIELAVETALRQGELLRLRWDEIDLKAALARIPVTKNGYPRVIPLSERAKSILEAWRGQGVAETKGRIFRMERNALKLAWRRLCKRARVADLHFHDLRHEAVSRLFEKGLSVPEVALISGHRDYRMLARYTHMNAEAIVPKLR